MESGPGRLTMATRPRTKNGNGFKMGSSKNSVRHIVRNNVAWKNKASGFYANHSSGGNSWYNNTSYSNGVQYNMLASPPGDPNTTTTLTGSLVHIMRNNLGFPNKNTNMTGVDSQFNSWDLSITPASKDFVSTTDPSMTVKDVSAESSGALGPRQKDGSLPNVDFLRLAAGSAMIDKGTDVGLAFADAAPDLGAYEFGAATSTNSTDGVGGASTGRGGTNAGGKATSGGAASNGVKVVTGGTNSSQVAAGGAANDGGGTAASPHGTGTRGRNPGTTQDSSNSGGIATSDSEDVSVGGQVALGSAPNSGANGGNVGLGTSPARTGDGSTPQDADGCDCRIVDLPLHRSRFAGGILMTLLLLRRPRRVQRAAADAAERGMPRAILQR